MEKSSASLSCVDTLSYYRNSNHEAVATFVGAGCAAPIGLFGLLVITPLPGLGAILLLFAFFMVFVPFLLMEEVPEHKVEKDALRDANEKFITNWESAEGSTLTPLESGTAVFSTGLFDVEGKALLVTDSRYHGIILSWRENGKVVTNVYTPDEILGCELVEDGVTVANSTSVPGGAAVGGLLFGGAGAIVGGMAANNPKGKVASLSLKLNIKDYNYPCWVIQLKTGVPIEKQSDVYKRVLDAARQWHGRVIAIKTGSNVVNVDQEPASATSNLPELNEPTPDRAQLIAEGESIRKAFEELTPDSPNYHITRAVLRDKYDYIRRKLSPE